MTTVINVTSKKDTNWQSVNWQIANRVVKNLRRRIFKATRSGRWKTVRNLQRLLMKTYSNILLAVRRCTQQNQGKKTPGVDGLVVLEPKARGLLVDILKKFIPWKPLPSKRVYIPKSNGKKHPLISASKTHFFRLFGRTAANIFSTASWALLPGRNP